MPRIPIIVASQRGFAHEEKGFIMLMDLHMHTLFSSDARMPMEAYCRLAPTVGVKALAFTEHYDANATDTAPLYFDEAAYFSMLHAMQARYGDRLLLLAGVEFSEPHLYPRQLAHVNELPLDVVIGSVHMHRLPDGKKRNYFSAWETPEQQYAAYWADTLACVRAGGFDVLGHMGLPYRRSGQLLYDEAQLRELFSLMLSRGIIPEINTSSARWELPDYMPNRTLLQLYRDCGGQYVTIGSDSHFKAHFCRPELYRGAAALVRELGLKLAVFEKRRLVEWRP